MKELIGNTPMIKIYYEYNGQERFIFAKLEYFNLTGSIKDRIAYYIINKSKLNGTLKDNMPIVEATSGNTGISIAAIGAAFGHPVIIFMPSFISASKQKLIKKYGANMKLINETHDCFNKCRELALKYATDIKGFYFNQFGNSDNVEAHYKTTANEIIEQLSDIKGFTSGVGSGGTLIGVGKKLKEENDKTLVVAIEPKNAPIISKNKVYSNHRIEGIGDGFIPEIYDNSIVDDVVLIDDDDAVNMTLKLSEFLGLGVGLSSGANMIGAIILEDRVRGNVATVFPDDNKKYLDDKLKVINPNNKNYISNLIYLKSYEVII